jgi:hypothetical protein
MIKAEDAHKTFSETLEAEYQEAELIIDSHIREMADGRVAVNLEHVTRSPRVIARLRRAYEEGGWLVVVDEGDQRDPGRVFRLEIASPPHSGPGVSR